MNEIIHLIKNALAMTEDRLSKNGDFGVYLHAKNQLEKMLEIASRRKSTDLERNSIDIDTMAAKELEADDFEYADILCRAAHAFKHLK